MDQLRRAIKLAAALIKNVSNRDKFLKTIQYILKLRALKGKKVDSLKSLEAVLSLSRLVYRLGDWLEPLLDILEGPIRYDLEYTETVISFLNSIIDDILCLNKATKGLLPVLSGPLRDSLDLWSTKLWLASTLINMTIIYRKMSDDKMKAGIDQKLAMTKYMFDVIFCLYDIYGWQSGREVPILSGILAAGIGLYRSARKL